MFTIEMGQDGSNSTVAKLIVESATKPDGTAPVILASFSDETMVRILNGVRGVVSKLMWTCPVKHGHGNGGYEADNPFLIRLSHDGGYRVASVELNPAMGVNVNGSTMVMTTVSGETDDGVTATARSVVSEDIWTCTQGYRTTEEHPVLLQLVHVFSPADAKTEGAWA